MPYSKVSNHLTDVFSLVQDPILHLVVMTPPVSSKSPTVLSFYFPWPWPFLKSVDQLFYRMFQNLDFSKIQMSKFSISRLNSLSFGKKTTGVILMPLSVHQVRTDLKSTWVSSLVIWTLVPWQSGACWLLHYQVAIFLFVINYCLGRRYFEIKWISCFSSYFCPFVLPHFGDFCLKKIITLMFALLPSFLLHSTTRILLYRSTFPSLQRV